MNLTCMLCCQDCAKRPEVMRDDNVFLLKLPPNCSKDQNCVFPHVWYVLSHLVFMDVRYFLDIVSWRYNNNLFKPHCTLAHSPGLDALFFFFFFFFLLLKECVHKFYIVSIVFIVYIKLNWNIILSPCASLWLSSSSSYLSLLFEKVNSHI